MNPTRLVDIVTGKKKPQQNEDERLQLLPERRSAKTPLKPTTPKDVSNDISSTSPLPAPAGSLYRSLSFLIDDLKLLNYSGRDDINSKQIIVSGNSLEKAVNDLFIDENENEINEDNDLGDDDDRNN